MISLDSIKIDSSWKMILIDEFQKPYFEKIKEFIQNEKNA